MGEFLRDLFEAFASTLAFLLTSLVAVGASLFVISSKDKFSFTWFLSVLILMASIALLVWLVVGVAWGKRGQQKLEERLVGRLRQGGMSAEEYLEERYYRGEITKEEFEQAKEEWQRGDPSIVQNEQ